MSKNKDCFLIEEEMNRDIDNFRKIHLPLINVILIPLSYYFLFLINSLYFVEGFTLFFLLLFLNLKMLVHKNNVKDKKIKHFFYKEILSNIFSKYFSNFELNAANSLSMSKVKKHKLLKVEPNEENNKNEIQYIKFDKNNISYKALNIENKIDKTEYQTDTVDSGILLETQSAEEKFLFAIRDNNKFDYNEEFFKEEDMDLYLTNNNDFDEKYACYTNNNKLLNKFLTKELVDFLLNQYRLNRIEISSNNENIFIFINNISFDFNVEYTDNKVDLNKMIKNSNDKLTKINDLIENIIKKK